MRSGRTIVLLVVCTASVGAGGQGSPAGQDTQSVASVDSTGVYARKYSPALAITASALVPGLGQAYARKAVRGGFILAAEVIMGLVALDRYNSYRDDILVAGWGQDSVSAREGPFVAEAADTFTYTHFTAWSTAFADTSMVAFRNDSLRHAGLVDTLSREFVRAKMGLDLRRYDAHLSRAVFAHAACWMAGCYVFNLMDALQSTGRFSNDETRNPLAAGLLSAVPGLGLGQLYNGSLSKAGVVCMTHVGLGFMAFNYHQLMQECEGRLAEIEDPTQEVHAFAGDYSDRWQTRRKYAFRQRNTYLWYGLLFYFYGIFDAVVDAHLHDMRRHMQLKPDLVASGDGVSLRVSLDF